MVLFGPVSTFMGKIWMAYGHHCASVQTQAPFHFFTFSVHFYVDPLTNGVGK